MAMIARIRHLIGYVWYWRVRHWWYDKPQAAHFRLSAAALSLFMLLFQGIGVAIAQLRPQPQHAPQQAIVWVVVWLIIAIIAGLALALTANKKPPSTPDTQGQGPTAQDGKSAKRYYGTCCIEDPAELGWKLVGKQPIKQSSGK